MRVHRCIGGCFYGFVIANISDIVSYTNHNRSQYLKRMEEVFFTMLHQAEKIIPQFASAV